MFYSAFKNFSIYSYIHPSVSILEHNLPLQNFPGKFLMRFQILSLAFPSIYEKTVSEKVIVSFSYKHNDRTRVRNLFQPQTSDVKRT